MNLSVINEQVNWEKMKSGNCVDKIDLDLSSSGFRNINEELNFMKLDQSQDIVTGNANV